MSSDVGHDFMEMTKYVNMAELSDQQRGVEAPPLQLPVPDGARTVALPSPGDLAGDGPGLKPLIDGRSSVRAFARSPLSLDELSYLLWCTQGVKEGGTATLRTVPSAGARHAFETYLMVNRVDGLDAGLWRYLALDHRLCAVSEDASVAERLAEACLGQRFVARGAVTFIWSAVVQRMAWRY